MNPEDNNQQPTQDTNQTYQNSTTPVTSAPKQPPVPTQYPNQSPKGAKKILPVIIGGVILVIAITVGMLLLNRDNKSTTNQSGNKQTPADSTDKKTEDKAQEDASNKSEKSSQNDTKHKNNLAKLIAAVSQYAANNNGKMPSATDLDSAFISQYLSGQFNDPVTNNSYMIVETTPRSGEVQYKTSSTCDSNNTIIAGTTRQVAARVLLSDNSYHCDAN
jgi:FtsZ-interacting cell division protein ZipA